MEVEERVGQGLDPDVTKETDLCLAFPEAATIPEPAVNSQKSSVRFRNKEENNTILSDDGSGLSYDIFRTDSVAKEVVTPRVLAHSFRSRAGLPGLSQISEATSSAKKIFWVVLTLIALGLFLFHMISLIMQYTDFKTNIEYQVKSKRGMKFPAITFCNQNMIPRVPSNNIDYPRSQGNYADFLRTHNEAHGHQKNNLILWASFDDRNLTVETDFTHVFNAYYGNCYTFNMNGNLMTRRSLPGYGLQMILNIESYKYYVGKDHAKPDSKGAVIKVHQPGTRAIIAEGGIFMGPGTLNRLSVQKTELSRQGGSYSNCLSEEKNAPPSYYEGLYTRGDCENTCLQGAIITECCCYLKTLNRNLSMFAESWTPPRSDTGDVREDCRRENVTACKDSNGCWSGVWDKYDVGDIRCDECVDRCKESLYQVIPTSTQWPSEDRIEELKTDLGNTGDFLHGLNTFNQITYIKKDGNTTYHDSAILKNLLKVHIFYESMTAIYVTEVPAVGFAEFISEMNSSVGFWAGWSVWTVFQFWEFLADLVVLVSFGKKANGQKVDRTNSGADDAGTGGTELTKVITNGSAGGDNGGRGGESVTPPRV